MSANSTIEKAVLNKTQLAHLKSYIERRGFKEPAVMLEILDHFACKVEEILSEYPKKDFEEVVKIAHHSFGIKGFRPIAEHVEKSIQTKYKKIYFKEAQKTLLSIHGIGATAVAVLVGKLMLLSTHSEQYSSWWLALILAFFLMLIGIDIRLFRKNKANQSIYMQQVWGQDFILRFVIVQTLLNRLFDYPSINQVSVYIIGVLVFLSLLRFNINLKLKNQALKDTQDTEKQLIGMEL